MLVHPAVTAVKVVCKSRPGGCSKETAGCACVFQTDVQAIVSHLDVLYAGTHLGLKQLQSHGAGSGRRSFQKDRLLPCAGGAGGPESHWSEGPGESKTAVPKDRADRVFIHPLILFTRFRSKMTAAGFTISGKDHPICPVMLGDARLATVMAEDMLNRGETGRDFWI